MEDEGLVATLKAKMSELNKRYNPLAMAGEAMKNEPDPKVRERRAAERAALIRALARKPKGK
jgi:hypothetical protein